MADDSVSSLEKLAESGGIVLFGVFIQLGLGFLSRVLIARLLGTTNYGAIALGYTLLNFTVIAVVMGTDTGVGRYLPRFDELDHRRGVLTSAAEIILTTSVIVGIAGAILAEPLAEFAFGKPGLSPVVRVFALAVPLAALVRFAVGASRGMEQSLPRVYIQNIIMPVARFGLIALALVLGFQAVGVAWAYAGAYGIAAAASIYYLVRYTPLFGDATSVPMRTELLAFSAPLMLTATMDNLFHNVDTFLLGSMVATSEVGIYDAVYRVGQLLTVILTSFGFLFMPILSAAHAEDEHEEMRNLYQVVTKWIVFATLPIFLVIGFFPNVVVNLTFGSSYVAGAPTLSVLAVGFFITASAGLNGNALTAIGKPRLLMYTNVAVVIVNVGLNLVLIPRYGIFGAAVATTVCYILMDGSYIALLYRITGIQPFRRELMAPVTAAVGLWTVLTFVLRPLVANPLVLLLIEVVVYFGVYPYLILQLGGIESEDRALLNIVENRIGIDLSALQRVVFQYAN